MTDSEIRRFPFGTAAIEGWIADDGRLGNWPVVYILDRGGPGSTSGSKLVYVGETRNATARMKQHLATDKGEKLDSVRVIVDPRYNKSVCLDLESHLIRWFSGDGAFEVLNRNDGITDADYFDRGGYRENFREVFGRLKGEGLFSRTVSEIENSDLFKLSPFKALTETQAVAVEQLLESLVVDLNGGSQTLSVVSGEPGTGKTIIAIYLLKLIADIKSTNGADDFDPDSRFAEFFEDQSADVLRNRRVAFVIPQQSLRESVKRVFKKTPGLCPAMLLSPFDVGVSAERFDLLIVDEAHRLSQRANQASGAQNAKFRDINVALFGHDDVARTQLDWLRRQGDHLVLLLDPAQTVRPADLPGEMVGQVIRTARADHRFHTLESQMRVRAGDDYVGYVRSVLTRGQGDRRPFENYDIRMFDDLRAMRAAIHEQDERVGLSRLVAGYAWPWRSKADPASFDIELDGLALRWNSKTVDWIASPASRDEVGSIHTVQGYDLNYAGVIIGEDLRYSDERGLYIDRGCYSDKKGKENNPTLQKSYSDHDLLGYIANIYAVLLTRGIPGPSYTHAIPVCGNTSVDTSRSPNSQDGSGAAVQSALRLGGPRRGSLGFSRTRRGAVPGVGRQSTRSGSDPIRRRIHGISSGRRPDRARHRSRC